MSNRIPARTAPAVAGLCAVVTLVLAAGCNDSDPTSPTPPAEIRLTASGDLPPNMAVGSIAITGDRSAVAVCNNFSAVGDEMLVPFDPATGAVSATISARRVVTFSPPLIDDAGAPVSSTTTSLAAFAAASAGKLFVTTNNLRPGSGTYQPGTVLVFGYNAGFNLVTSYTGAIPTTFGGTTYYNPTSITRFRRAGGAEMLAVVCAGNFAESVTATVLVIDPATEAVVEAADIGLTTAGTGEAALGPDGTLYVGCASAPEVYVVSLASAPAAVVRGAANPVTFTSSTALFNLVPDLAVSGDGERLYALSSNDGALVELSLASPLSPVFVKRTRAMKRGGASDFDATCQTLAIRGGTAPGRDELLIGTAFIHASAQQLTDVGTAIDSVVVDGGVTSVRLDALVAPFPVFDAVQTIAAHGDRAYIGVNASGVVVVRSFDALR